MAAPWLYPSVLIYDMFVHLEIGIFSCQCSYIT